MILAVFAADFLFEQKDFFIRSQLLIDHSISLQQNREIDYHRFSFLA